jgi:MFS family permease
MAARFFQGFAAGPAANVGLSIINDISWEHERGYRIGLWAMSANVGSVLGGLGKFPRLSSTEGLTDMAVGGFIATVNQYWVAYHVTIAFAVLLLWELAFLPETQYPRAHVVALEQQQAAAEARGESWQGPALDIKRTKQLPWLVSQVSSARYHGMLTRLAEHPQNPGRPPSQTLGDADNILQAVGLPQVGRQRVWIHFSALLVVCEW